LDGLEVSKLVDREGTLSKNLVGYEHRPQQVTMTGYVAQAFTEGKQILVEAPTGVGKSLAYLLPAARFASDTGERVIISTNTIALQDQLINKDVPLVRETLGLDFSAAILKGRANYLCPRRLEALRIRGPNSSEETQMLARILVWLSSDNGTGDRGDITIRGPIEGSIWSKLSAEDEGCKLERCSNQMEGICPFYQARTLAERANLLIVNHSLLLADAATDGRVLPEYDHLIVDEAHHLEEATTNGLSFQTDQSAIGRHLLELGSGNKGILGEMLRRTHEAIPPGYFETLSEFVSVVVQASSYMSQHVEWFFLSLRTFLERAGKVSRDEYSSQTRIVEALRRQPGWASVQSSWENLSQFTASIAEAMVRLEGGLRDLSEYDIEDYDDLMSSVGAAARHFSEFHNRLDQLVNKPDSNTIYWIEYQSYNDKLTVHAAPLDVGPLLQRHLWDSKHTIVMTSATLRTQGSFDYIRQQLDADHMTEHVIGSPFDYKNSTLLYLVNDIPEPTDQDGYQRAMERGLISLCESTNGRTLVLFTSYAQLRRTASAITASLAKSGIVVYDQAGGNSRTQLLDGFVQTDKSVLLGTRTFWEGVDVPGSDLSVVVITRLPFSVPHDPIFAARSEQYQDAFNQFAIPETILKFRQGFGRLIRRKSDLGVAVILDRRILTKRYGRLFIEALPECTSKVGPLSDLASSAADWLGES
jgi:DNA polymerase-3 subunit epsilon/ATP-dependent DNA helicase DinG